MIAARNGHSKCLEELLKYEKARKTIDWKNDDDLNWFYISNVGCNNFYA